MLLEGGNWGHFLSFWVWFFGGFRFGCGCNLWWLLLLLVGLVGVIGRGLRYSEIAIR